MLKRVVFVRVSVHYNRYSMCSSTFLKAYSEISFLASHSLDDAHRLLSADEALQLAIGNVDVCTRRRHNSLGGILPENDFVFTRAHAENFEKYIAPLVARAEKPASTSNVLFDLSKPTGVCSVRVYASHRCKHCTRICITFLLIR